MLKLLLEGGGLLCLDIKSKTGSLVDSGEPQFTTTMVAKVGEATAAVLLDPNETKNQYVHVSSFTVNQNQIAEALERISGAKFNLTNLSHAELFARGTKNVEAGDWKTGYYELATTAMYSGANYTLFPEKAAYWNKALGLVQEESFDDVIRRVLKSGTE